MNLFRKTGLINILAVEFMYVGSHLGQTFLSVHPSSPPNLPLRPIFFSFQPSSPSYLPLRPIFLSFLSSSPSNLFLFPTFLSFLSSAPSYLPLRPTFLSVQKHPLPPCILSVQQTVSVSPPLFILSLQSSSVSRLYNKLCILSKLGYKDTPNLG